MLKNGIFLHVMFAITNNMSTFALFNNNNCNLKTLGKLVCEDRLTFKDETFFISLRYLT